MTIEQAIEHAEDVAISAIGCECREEHRQLAAWLRELQERRKAPEIVHCGECKWWTKQKNSGQGRCELLGIYPTGGWHCANGVEERTDG